MSASAAWPLHVPLSGPLTSGGRAGNHNIFPYFEKKLNLLSTMSHSPPRKSCYSYSSAYRSARNAVNKEAIALHLQLSYSIDDSHVSIPASK